MQKLLAAAEGCRDDIFRVDRSLLARGPDLRRLSSTLFFGAVGCGLLLIKRVGVVHRRLLLLALDVLVHFGFNLDYLIFELLAVRVAQV